MAMAVSTEVCGGEQFKVSIFVAILVVWIECYQQTTPALAYSRTNRENDPVVTAGVPSSSKHNAQLSGTRTLLHSCREQH